MQTVPWWRPCASNSSRRARRPAFVNSITCQQARRGRARKEKTFNGQEESDPIIEDLEVMPSTRCARNCTSSPAIEAAWSVRSRWSTTGNTLDCMKHGLARGTPCRASVEPDVIQFKKCSAKFILHVEKDTVWRRFYEDRFHETHHCIVTHGGGQPARGMRRLLRRMHDELKLPVYCLLDNDPWGYYIYSVIKQGSISLAYESRRMAVPDAPLHRRVELRLRSLRSERRREDHAWTTMTSSGPSRSSRIRGSRVKKALGQERSAR